MIKRLIPIALGMLLFVSTEMTSQEIIIVKPDVEETEEHEVEIVDNENEMVSTPQETEEPQIVSLGEFRITAYCPCTLCSDNWGTQTSTGVTATQGRTIAVDPRVIPYGTKVMFNGNEYIAEDCGGAIKQKRIDLYFDSHQEALEWGVQYHEIFIVVESEE